MPLNEKYLLMFLYLLSLFFLYPAIVHLLMNQFDFLSNILTAGRFWIIIRVFFSGPALIVLGLIVFSRYRWFNVNRLIGFVLMCTGVCWMYILLSDIINEAA